MELGKRKIEISKKTLNFISKNFKKMNIDNKEINQINSKTVILEFSIKELETIMDCLSNYLLKYGLNKDDSLNEKGIYIESLIDTFSDFLYYS